MKWLVLLLLIPFAAADHDTGSYRCDGGWCADGQARELDCRDACTGDRTGFPSILHPAFGDGSWLEADDWVLGVARHGEAKAYPIRIISGEQGWETVVDTIGDEPIIVTYCPLCASGVVYSRIFAGSELELRNSGAIWHADLVMYDEESEHLWSQVTGEAIGVLRTGEARNQRCCDDGPLHGQRLTLLGSEMVRWHAWRDAHPATVAMELPRDADGRALCQCGPNIGSLRPSQMVHAVDDLAFPWNTMASVQLVQIPDRDWIAVWAGGNVHVYEAGGRTFAFQGGLVADDGRQYNALTGEGEDASLTKLPGVTMLDYRWRVFHPDGTMYTPPSEPVAKDSPVPWSLILVALAITWRYSGSNRT